jgi:hypothetical protein
MDTGQKELYNLKNDPHELNNLVEKETRVAYELEQKLFNWLRFMGQDEYYHNKLLKDVFKVKE